MVERRSTPLRIGPFLVGPLRRSSMTGSSAAGVAAQSIIQQLTSAVHPMEAHGKAGIRAMAGGVVTAGSVGSSGFRSFGQSGVQFSARSVVSRNLSGSTSVVPKRA